MTHETAAEKVTPSMKKGKSVRLSPSALNLYGDCRTCFWLDRTGTLKRPRGIFPSLPNGMDHVIKIYFDGFRKNLTLPPELRVSAFEGCQLFADQKKMDLWRDWRTGLVYREADGSWLTGALDELMLKDGLYIPFDYKTKGSPTTAEAAVKYYQNQLDCYGLMLEANGMPPAGYGYLLYYSPKEVKERGAVSFHIQAIKIDVDPNRARKTFRDAVDLIKAGRPSSNSSCEYCMYLEKFKTG